MATDDAQAREDQDETTPDEATRTAETAADHRDGGESPAEMSPAELKAEAERLRKQLKETNRKAAADRARIEEIDREKQRQEEGKLTEVQRIKKQLRDHEARAVAAEQKAANLERALLDRRLDGEIERAARGHFLNPDLAPRLVDRDRIQHDPDTDRFAGVKEAVERVLRDYPDLASTKKGGGSPAAMQTRRPGATAAGNAGAGDPASALLEQFIATGNYEQM